MKIINHIPDDKKSNIEISIQKKQEVEKFIFIGVLKPKPNQRVFKVNLISGEVSEVLFFNKSKTINYLDVINKKQSIKERDIIIKEGYDYVIKLNIENAVKYFQKKWKDIEIFESSEKETNNLLKNQRKKK